MSDAARESGVRQTVHGFRQRLLLTAVVRHTHTKHTDKRDVDVDTGGVYEISFNKSLIFSRSPWILGKVILPSYDLQQKSLLIPTKNDKKTMKGGEVVDFGMGVLTRGREV